MDKNETLSDIVADLRQEASDCPDIGRAGIYDRYADRIEAALKREADSIHRAMVLIAGIEMESPEDPPRLWTALEDAYDALSDALGTDGDTTADEEEAKATGRHFVVKPSGNPAAMRELKACKEAVLDFCNVFTLVYPPNDGDCPALLAGAFEPLKNVMGIETVEIGKGENDGRK